MNNLEQQVSESAVELQKAWVGVQKLPSSASLPRACYDQWKTKAALYQVVSGTHAIFRVRATAWEIVQSTVNPDNIIGNPEESKVLYGKLITDFAIARHLALTSYVAITWSIYDRLANACGRLAGISDAANNPRQNPKLCEELLGEKEEAGKRKKKDTLGFASHFHIQEAYSWPLRLSYKIRNWLVHEGYEEGSTQLFRGNKLSDGFLLHPDAVKYLQNCCNYKEDNGRISSTCIGATDECWKHSDLLRILEQYNNEIDTMFTALLKWSVDSFVGQIRAFAARDQA